MKCQDFFSMNIKQQQQTNTQTKKNNNKETNKMKQYLKVSSIKVVIGTLMVKSVREVKASIPYFP